MNCFTFVVSLLAYSTVLTLIANALPPVLGSCVAIAGIVAGIWFGTKLLNHEN